MTKALSYISIILLMQTSCMSQENNTDQPGDMPTANVKLDTATLGAGCFWCVEAIFQNIEGVYTVVAGYSGGHVKNPTYKEVCDGGTGHVEVAQITYNPKKISFEELLDVFWRSEE